MSADLIARLEAATGPDRELDHTIDMTITGEWTYYAPEYTRSIDAALTLLPDNTGLILYCILGKKPSVSTQRYEWDDHVSAATVPLALCIAALKARAVAS